MIYEEEKQIMKKFPKPTHPIKVKHNITNNIFGWVEGIMKEH